MEVDSPNPVQQGAAVGHRETRPRVPQIPQGLLDNLPRPPRPESRDNIPLVMGTQSWHRIVPQVSY